MKALKKYSPVSLSIAILVSLVGFVALYAGINTVSSRFDTIAGLRAVGMPPEWALRLVSLLGPVEIFIGSGLILFPNDKHIKVTATLMFAAFTMYLVSITLIQVPTDCGCHNVLTVFVSIKNRAVAGIVTNILVISALVASLRCKESPGLYEFMSGLKLK